MKVIIFIPGFHGGGAERQCLYLSEGLTKLGANVITSFFYLGDYEEMVNTADFKKYQLKGKRFASPINILKFGLYLRREKPDIVFSWLPVGDIYAGLTRLFIPASKWVVAERNSTYSDIPVNNVRNYLIRKYAHGIVANSPKGLKFWQDRTDVHTAFISNIVKGQGQIQKKNPKYLLFAGRLEDQKNIFFTFEIFKHLARQADIKSLFIGNGIHKVKLQGLIEKENLSHLISIIEFKKDISKYYAESIAFINLSLFEGTPNTIIENVVLKNKVIVSNIAEHYDFLGEDYPFFVDNEGDPLIESKKIMKYLKRPLTEEDYDFANQKIKTMSANDVAKQYEVFLEKVYHENSN